MFGENLKRIRNARGISQEELAQRIHVVRQTVSKWETGRSVPDAVMLQALAQELNTTVSELLGEPLPSDDASALQTLMEQPTAIHEPSAQKREIRYKKQRMFFFLLGTVSVGFAIKGIVGAVYRFTVTNALHANDSVIGGSDVSTGIYVVSGWVRILPVLLPLVAATVSAVGIVRTRRRK